MSARKILIVDDNVQLSRMLKLQLESTGGFVVRVENSSPRAVATTREFQPQVVILDVMMPELDGGRLAAMLRDEPGFGELPVIFLTGSVRKEEVDDRRGIIGGMPFLAKPAKLDELLGWIDRLAPG